MRKVLIAIVLCQSTLFGFCQQTAPIDQEVIIPLDISSSRPIVELTIDGEGPYQFIFDTGSSAHVIDEGLSQKLGFKVVGEDPLRTPGSENRLVSQRVAVPNVGIAGTGITKDAEMNVIGLRAMLPVDGILSGIFFEDYLVTLDYPGSKLILQNGALDVADEDVTAFIQKPRVLNLNLDIDGHLVEAHLDTGSPGGFSLPYALRDQLTFKESPKQGSPIRTPVATFKRWDAELVGVIGLGNVKYENPKVALIEGFEFANLGYQVIKDLRTTIDRKNNLIKFEQSNEVITVNETVETNDLTGWYGGQIRKVFIDNGQLYLQRADTKLKLESMEQDLYQMTFDVPVRNELPKVRFERNEKGKVNGLTFIYKDGREEFVKKD